MPVRSMIHSSFVPMSRSSRNWFVISFSGWKWPTPSRFKVMRALAARDPDRVRRFRGVRVVFAAVDADYLAVDPRSLGLRQQEDHARHVLGRREPPARVAQPRLALELVAARDRAQGRRVGHAGLDDVAAD